MDIAANPVDNGDYHSVASPTFSTYAHTNLSSLWKGIETLCASFSLIQKPVLGNAFLNGPTYSYTEGNDETHIRLLVILFINNSPALVVIKKDWKPSLLIGRRYS